MTVKEVAEALRAGAGIDLAAARNLAGKYGTCSPTTIRTYLKRYPELVAIKEEIREDIKDIAESELFKAVKAGDQKAVQFLLRTVGKDRGYSERVESTGRDGGPIQHEDVTRDADEFVSRMERLAVGVQNAGDDENA